MNDEFPLPPGVAICACCGKRFKLKPSEPGRGRPQINCSKACRNRKSAEATNKKRAAERIKKRYAYRAFDPQD